MTHGFWEAGSTSADDTTSSKVSRAKRRKKWPEFHDQDRKSYNLVRMKKFEPDKLESEFLPSKLNFNFDDFLDGSETKFWEPELRGENLGMSYDFRKEYSHS